MSVIFTDQTLEHEWYEGSYKNEDLKRRTEVLKTELELLQEVTNEHTISLRTQQENQEHIALVLGALTLSQMDIITKEELRRLYKMMISPDKENYLVAQECIRGKLNDFKEGKI